MPENEMDPAASTQMFRAFVDGQTTQQPAAPAARSGGLSPMVVGGAVAVIAVIALVLWLALG